MDKQKNWLFVPFTSVFDIQGGTQPPKSSFIHEPRKGYVQLLQIRDFGSKPVPTYVPQNGNLKYCDVDDILIGRYGASVGKILTGHKGAYNVALAKVIIPDNFNKRYVYHLLGSNYFQESILLTERSAQNGFNKTDLAKILLPIAPLNEQNQIAKLLDTLLDKILGLQTQLDTLPTKISSIGSLIVSRALSGELTKEWRSRSKAVPLKSSGKGSKKSIQLELGKNFSQDFALSYANLDELPPIPLEWKWNYFKSLAKIQGGVTKGRKLSAAETLELPYLRVANVQDGFLDLHEIKFIPIKKEEKKKYLLQKGDILLTEGGDRDKLGRGTVWNNEIEDCLYQNHIFRARVDQSQLHPEFISIATKSKFSRDYFFKNASQTVNLASINLTTLGNLPIPVPSIEEQREIAKIVTLLNGSLNKLRKRHEQFKQHLRAYKTVLVGKAFSGELLDSNFDTKPIRLQTEDDLTLTIKKRKNIKLKTKKDFSVAEYQSLKEVLEANNGKLSPKDLWDLSPFKGNIDAFYDRLKLEIEVLGQIKESKEKAHLMVVENEN